MSRRSGEAAKADIFKLSFRASSSAARTIALARLKRHNPSTRNEE
jgi:hypothetical protein